MTHNSTKTANLLGTLFKRYTRGGVDDTLKRLNNLEASTKNLDDVVTRREFLNRTGRTLATEAAPIGAAARAARSLSDAVQRAPSAAAGAAGASALRQANPAMSRRGFLRGAAGAAATTAAGAVTPAIRGTRRAAPNATSAQDLLQSLQTTYDAAQRGTGTNLARRYGHEAKRYARGDINAQQAVDASKRHTMDEMKVQAALAFAEDTKPSAGGIGGFMGQFRKRAQITAPLVDVYAELQDSAVKLAAYTPYTKIAEKGLAERGLEGLGLIEEKGLLQRGLEGSGLLKEQTLGQRLGLVQDDYTNEEINRAKALGGLTLGTAGALGGGLLGRRAGLRVIKEFGRLPATGKTLSKALDNAGAVTEDAITRGDGIDLADIAMAALNPNRVREDIARRGADVSNAVFGGAQDVVDTALRDPGMPAQMSPAQRAYLYGQTGLLGLGTGTAGLALGATGLPIATGLVHDAYSKT